MIFGGKISQRALIHFSTFMRFIIMSRASTFEKYTTTCQFADDATQ